jgi:outer membrane murein-binding lipoprotein Lpp
LAISTIHHHSPSPNSTISSTHHFLFEGCTCFEQVHAIGDHVNHLKSHVKRLSNDINHVTNKISNMESEFHQTNQQLVAVIELLNVNNNQNDEQRYTHSSTPALPTQSQQQSHQNINHPTQTTSIHTDHEKDISYETKSKSTNQKIDNSHVPNLHKSFESQTAGNPSSNVTTNHTNNAHENASMAPNKTQASKPSHIIHHPIPIKPAPKTFQPVKQAQNDININSTMHFNSNPFFSILESSKLKYSSLETYFS